MFGCRGVRGAIVVEPDDDHCLDATVRLLDAIADANGFGVDEVAAVIFTVTDDLEAHPGRLIAATRWHAVPLLIVKDGSGIAYPSRLLRALVLWNTDRAQHDVEHVYLGAAAELRPDLTRPGTPPR